MQTEMKTTVDPDLAIGGADDIAMRARATLQAMVEMMPPDAAALAAKFLASADQVGPYESYKVFPAAATAIVDGYERDHGVEERRRFLRFTIIHAILATIASVRFLALPPRVAIQQGTQLLRIAADKDSGAEWLDIRHDLFQKELGLAMMRLYAAGAQLIDFRCGVPRGIVQKGGAGKVLPTLLAIWRMGGFRPYFQIHTHEFMLGNFNEEGWNECYRCCSELYVVHPEVLGMFGASWFYDPALETISPRLSYLRKVPMDGGAHLFFVEAGAAARANSLSTSPTRRKLYEEGKYLPTIYMMVWGRSAQTKWANTV